MNYRPQPKGMLYPLHFTLATLHTNNLQARPATTITTVKCAPVRPPSLNMEGTQAVTTPPSRRQTTASTSTNRP